ncbi:MAG: hypothetical protein L0H59_10455 [Tomitella sp.]|nr:hypothetical protein [Tomitella sp.]
MLFIYLAGVIIVAGLTMPLVAAVAKFGTLAHVFCLGGAAVISAVAIAVWGVYGIAPFAVVTAVVLWRQLRDAVQLYPDSPQQRINSPAA